ncbi:MAG: DUF2207 domain-containing protein, partial [Rhodospirillaceae bacterium]|nr:DUF2207 domain-containing protein [Rhodospirillaceae bacterium]
MAVLVLAVASAQAQERITLFDSHVVVESNSDLLVTETIEVIAEGDQIKRGIFRDFPVGYGSDDGFDYEVIFDVQQVLRDGTEEPWFTQRDGNSVQLFIGDPRIVLPDGPYRYTIVYRTDLQVTYFNDADELVWNVTGHDWQFPIDVARVEIVLPEGAIPETADAYAGSRYTTNGAAEIALTDRGMVATTTLPLELRQGLTAAVSWPKGFVAQPGRLELWLRLLAGGWEKKTGFIWAQVGLAIPLIYFLAVWLLVGRNPKRGTIIARFEPPEGMSPSEAGYLWRGGFHNHHQEQQTLVVTLISMATRGVITFLEIGQGDAEIKRTGEDEESLQPSEATALDQLFAGHRSSVRLGTNNDEAVRQAVLTLVHGARRAYPDAMTRSNRGYWYLGLLLTALASLHAVYQETDGSVAIWAMFLGFFLIGGVTACLRVLQALWRKIRALFGTRGGDDLAGRAGFGLLIGSLIGIGGSGLLLQVHVSNFTLISQIILWCAALSVVTVMPALTREGRAVLDHLEGYHRYLSVAEARRFSLMAGEPVMTLERFEQHLPFAMALGVAKKWSTKFAALASTIAPEETYRAQWIQSGDIDQSDFEILLDFENRVGQAVRSSARPALRAASILSSRASSGSSSSAPVGNNKFRRSNGSFRSGASRGGGRSGGSGGGGGGG